MIKFVTFAVKLQLNVHDLNNESRAGNVTDIRLMEFLDEEGNKVEAPAVSGRMLKRWHSEIIRQLINHGDDAEAPLCDGCKIGEPDSQGGGRRQKPPLCDGCKIGEPIRPAKLKNDKLVQEASPERDSISACINCDIHGYLIAQGAEKPGKGGVSSRRSSRVMFSWLMPVIAYDFSSKQVIHTRVSQQRATEEGETAAQMIFSKSYASGVYAFVSALDVERIGLVELDLGNDSPYAVSDDERKDRAKVAIEAYRYLISGKLGASLSHAVPHSNPLEMLVAYSESGPLPFPVSPMYSDYIIKTKGLMPLGRPGTKLLYWSANGGERAGIIVKESIGGIFGELLDNL